MPVVTILQSTGRTHEQKQLLISRITDAFQEVYSVSPDAVTVFYQEFDDENWGKAGKIASEKQQ